MAGAAIAGGLIGGIGGLVTDIIGGVRAERAQRRFRRRQRRAIGEARQFADETVRRITEGGLFQQGTEFLQSTFGAAEDSPLVQDFVKQLRSAQSARGLFFGGASAQAEAGGLAVASQRLRQGLLPQLQSFALAPEQLRQSVLGQEANLRVAAATGAALPGLQQPDFIDPIIGGIRSGIQGAAGGAALGAEFGGGAPAQRGPVLSPVEDRFSRLPTTTFDAEQLAFLQGGGLQGFQRR